MNRLFIANKPIGISSNKFLNSIKKKYGAKKAGFSGTLDPFASGAILIALNDYTKLFRFIKKEHKTYLATLWLGVQSKSLDNQNITKIEFIKEYKKKDILNIFKQLIGEISYYPPKYCAKKIDGKRAYNMARKDEEFELKKITTKIFDIKLIHYTHPFINFKITLQEGGYVRSIAELITKKLNCTGTLSSLKRIKEGELSFNFEEPLNPFEHLNIKTNIFYGKKDDFLNGKRLNISDFKIKDDGKYLINLKEFYSIIEINKNQISYILNRISLWKAMQN